MLVYVACVLVHGRGASSALEATAFNVKAAIIWMQAVAVDAHWLDAKFVVHHHHVYHAIVTII